MIPLLQNLFLKDFWLKLFSLALASLIYFVVNIAIKKDISPGTSLSLAPSEQMILRDLPIVVLSSSDDQRPVNINPKVALVKLQGDPANLRNLRRQDVRVMVDLTEPAALRGSRQRIEVSAPAGISHLQVDPEEVQISTVTNN